MDCSLSQYVSVKEFLQACLYRFAVGLGKVILIPYILHCRIVGKHNLEKFSSGIVVANHIHALDCGMVSVPLLPRYLRFTTQQENFDIPIAGKILAGVGCIPVLRGSQQARDQFNRNVEEQIDRGNSVVIYPEGDIGPYERNLQPFHKGAFHVAVTLQAPVLPMVAVPEYRDPSRSLRNKVITFLRRGRLGYRIEILPPMYPPTPHSEADYGACVTQFRDDVAAVMQKHLMGLETQEQ